MRQIHMIGTSISEWASVRKRPGSSLGFRSCNFGFQMLSRHANAEARGERAMVISRRPSMSRDGVSVERLLFVLRLSALCSLLRELILEVDGRWLLYVTGCRGKHGAEASTYINVCGNWLITQSRAIVWTCLVQTCDMVHGKDDVDYWDSSAILLSRLANLDVNFC